MKKYLVLLSFLNSVCFAVDVFAVSTYGGYAQVGYAMNQNMNTHKKQADELVIDDQTYYCNRALYRGGTNCAGDDVLTVVSAQLNTITKYKCVVSTFEDKWEKQDFFSCQNSPLKDIGIENSYVALADGEIKSDKYYIVNGKPNIGTTIVYNGDACAWVACKSGFKEQGGKCVNENVPKRKCGDIKHEGYGQVDCPDSEEYQNADKCKVTCNDGVWENHTVRTCDNSYFLRDDKCIAYGSACDEVDAAKQNATEGKYVTDGKGGYVCAATQCKKGAYLVVKDSVSQGWCVYETYCKNNPNTKLNIIDGTKTDLTCVPIKEPAQAEVAGAVVLPQIENNVDNEPVKTTISPVEEQNEEAVVVVEETVEEVVENDFESVVLQGAENGTACESTDKNATAGIWYNGVCVPAMCRDGYEIVNNICVLIGGDCEKLPENSVTAHRAWDDANKVAVCIIDKCVENYNLSDDKKTCIQDKKAIAQSALDKAKAKEQSTANKLLGGATMAATGIGGMQAMSAISEQNADEDAEQAMRAYLATFHCNYGGGMNIPGGEKDIELPGGNELVGLYSEYVNLANDLKARKNALGMKPGIESESILDSATSGLYDDVSIGKTSGAFTSLARALMEPNGPDAAAWAQQKSDTAQKLKTGATIAGIGAVGGVAGNLLINGKDDKKVDSGDKSDKSKQVKVGNEKLTDKIKAKAKDVKADVATDEEAALAVVTESDVGAQVVAITTVPDKPEETVQVEVSDITQQVAAESGESGDELLEKLSQSLGREPSYEVKVAWQEYADKCKDYGGVLILERLSSFEKGYGLMCEFVDLEQTDDSVMELYETSIGRKYFTTEDTNLKMRLEKKDEYKNSRYGKNDAEAWNRWADMNSSWLVVRNSLDVGDGKYINADGRYRALIYVKPDMTLLMEKHNNGNMTEYEVK